jgi:hypothetical protein
VRPIYDAHAGSDPPAATFLFNPAPGLGFLFDIYLLYRHSNELEKGTFYEKTADYTWTLTLVAALSMVRRHLASAA